ncbi:Coiled-coil domain-containing protein 81 [Schistosoma haematobium]|uniref:Coiled-coil domain-containing protein 81 n=1 Tax=Schistosoma haematobium TaxID=6185 RepID=A0A922LNU6_SCHHA|nr:Coiled-coil domain-containing protein 81 [Schistosoma haematobium]KAH9590604.1 Coiled-coil domain-containing protein 81 [Schistosoma haematobium]CAH8659095.1 unnamed protein product [Schistosoma haematobium]CAH8665216.1 unnamed protein product [Schistosoma haematobium]
MSIGNKKYSQISSFRPNDRDVPRAPALPNRTSARSWHKSESSSKEMKKLSKELPHVKSCASKCQQSNQKQLVNITPSACISKFSLKSVNDKEIKHLNFNRITNIQIDVKPSTTYTSAATNNTHRLRRSIIRKDEKDFLSSFEKKYSIHNYNPLKLNNNCHISKPDYKHALSLTTGKSELVKKVSVNQSDHSKCSNYLSLNGSQLSSWLLQCDNASTTLHNKKEAIDSTPRGYVNSYLSSQPFIKQSTNVVVGSGKSIDFNEQKSNGKAKRVSNELNTISSGYSIKKHNNRNHKTYNKPTNINASKYYRCSEIEPSEQLIDNEFDENVNSSAAKYYDINSTNVTDWGSVSSSEWGDDMCEFDRQQSFRVHEMFEEIDRILFDNSNLDLQDSILRYTSITTTNVYDEPSQHINTSNIINSPSCTDDYDSMGLDNFALMSLDSIENRNPPYQYPDHLNSSVTNCINNNPCGIQDHLFYECKDWLSRFPHLRVVGKQIKLSDENKSTFHHDDSNLISEFSNMINVSSTIMDTSLNMKKVITDRRLNHIQSKTGKIEEHLSSSLTSTNCMEEEIFAIDGEYEEFTDGVTVSSKYNPTCNIEQSKQLSSYDHTHIQDKLLFDGKEPKISKSHQSNKNHGHHKYHGYHHFRHKHKEKSNPAPTHSNSEEYNDKLCILPDAVSNSCFPSSPCIALERVKQPDSLDNCHSESDFTSPLLNSVEMILRIISQQLWNDLTQWMKMLLSENTFPNLNKYETNGISQKASHSPFQSHLLHDTTFSRCDSSVGDAQNPSALPSFRLFKQTKHSNSDTPNCLIGQHAVQTHESNIELADLLQISTKTLQTREKSLVQENIDPFTKIQYTGSNTILKDSTNNHSISSVGGSQLTSVTMTTITTTLSRISPQSIGTISINRPISSLNNKSATNVPRKFILTCNNSVPEISHHSRTSGVAVIGVAANLYHNEKLAPLDRLRTPLPPQYSSISEEPLFSTVSSTTANIHFTNTETSLNSTCSASLAKCHNLNVSQLLSPVTVSNALTSLPLVITTTILHTVPNSINSSSQILSVNTTSMMNETTSSGNFTLPPLSNPINILSTVTTAICFPPSNSLNIESSLPNPKINLFTNNKTGFGIYQGSEQSNQHTTHLHKKICENLVAKQNNISNTLGNTSIFTQRIPSKSSMHWNQNSPKQASFPLPPIDIFKDRFGRKQKLWRPYSSRPLLLNKPITNPSSMLTRACSTLLIQNPEIYNDSCSIKISPAIFIGSTTNPIRGNDAVTR